MTATVSIIAAVARNGVIGTGDGLPWRLPSDFAYFKRTTMGRPLIMGRRTFEGIGKPLPGRTNIIVTRQSGFSADGALVAQNLPAALELARQTAARDGVDELFIGGGGEIYREAMPMADRLHITHVDLTPDGDTTFPEIDPGQWEIVGEPDVPRGPKDQADFKVKVYERRGS